MENNFASFETDGMYLKDFEKDACGIGLIYTGLKSSLSQTVPTALKMLANLSHRSALGADGKTSDGAGILLQLVPEFFKQQEELKSKLEGHLFSVGMMFYPAQDLVYLNEQKKKVSDSALQLGMQVLAWRDVPVDSSVLGSQAKYIEPKVIQVFLADIDTDPSNKKTTNDERRLFLLKSELQRTTLFDVISLSSKTIIYKGLSLPSDLGNYYLDLQSPQMVSRFALVHSRFSTNTLPAWRLAQPFSTICHNGEINTLRGNLTWLKAREKQVTQLLSSDRSVCLQPLILPGQSDSQYLDDMVCILRQSGYSLPKALMTLMPEPWGNQAPLIDTDVGAFYEFQAPRMEPWDGPAAVCFCDGQWMGAKLDRNGLRPCRYQILDDGTLILSSETGVVEVSHSQIKKQGRLGPGQMIAVDITSGKIIFDSEIKKVWPKACHTKTGWLANVIKSWRK